MDIFSGNVPRKFIPLRLGLPTEECQTPIVHPDPLATSIVSGLPPSVSIHSTMNQAESPKSNNSSGDDVTEYASAMASLLEEKESADKN